MAIHNHLAHQFSLFIEQSFIESTININDPILYHRIIRVLRCSVGSIVQLFNRQQHAQATLVQYTKKECFFRLICIEDNVPLQPHITLGLPLLKNNDLDEAVSLATQVGVSAIQLLITDYSRHVFDFVIESKRLMRVVIAATEQSKRFYMPIIKEPISFADLKKKYTYDVLMFGAKNGADLATALKNSLVNGLSQTTFLFIVGPEADFSSAEYEQLKQWQAQDVCFGPTVLRSCTAAGIGIGCIRALTFSVR